MKISDCPSINILLDRQLLVLGFLRIFVVLTVLHFLCTAAVKKKSVWADVLLEQQISSKIKSGAITEEADSK